MAARGVGGYKVSRGSMLNTRMMYPKRRGVRRCGRRVPCNIQTLDNYAGTRLLSALINEARQ